jgi:hypothetical protein
MAAMDRDNFDGTLGTPGTGQNAGQGLGSTSGGAGGLGGTAGSAGAYGGSADLGATGTTGSSGTSGSSGTFGSESADLGGAESTGTGSAGRNRLSQVKEKASDLKATLADKLEAGADRLRQRNTPTLAAAGGDGSATAATDDTMAQVGDKVAGGMKASADWLRNNDLDSMKQSIETQVRTNPGRSLLIAAVAGYLLGKAFRR